MTDKTPHKIQNMFDEISPYYDEMNNIISFGLHNFIKKDVLKHLGISKNSYVLDLCCGTGDFSNIINKIQPFSRVIGLDNSKEMLKLAKNKNPNNTFLLADSTNLPFGNEEFDFVTAGFGLRNIENRSKALSEIYRVLKRGGKFLHLDFGEHNFMLKIFDYFVPFFVEITGRNPDSYKYLLKSKNEYPEPEELIKEFKQFGFTLIQRKDYLFGAISAQIFKK